MFLSTRFIPVILGGLFCISNAALGDEKNLIAGVDAAREGYYEEAATLLEPLARGGDAAAQFALGLLFHSGMGVTRDEGKALWLYQESAKSGYEPAMEYVIVGYQEGWFGLPKDAQKAKDWSKRLRQQL